VKGVEREMPFWIFDDEFQIEDYTQGFRAKAPEEIIFAQKRATPF
jgi:hypothetical protein